MPLVQQYVQSSLCGVVEAKLTVARGSIAVCYELCFRPLRDKGQRFAFPCNAAGLVDLDVLSCQGRNHYFYARTLIGHCFFSPTVQAVPAQSAGT